MMKKTSNILAFFLSMLMLVSQSWVFAMEIEPENKTIVKFCPSSMTQEERIAWIIDNVEPTYYVANEVKTSAKAGNTTYYTGTNITYFGPNGDTSNTLYQRGYLRAGLSFACNSNNTKVEYCQIDNFTVVAHSSLATKNPNTVKYQPDNSVIQYTFEAWVSDETGVYYVAQIYHLYASGTYSLRRFSTSADDEYDPNQPNNVFILPIKKEVR